MADGSNRYAYNMKTQLLSDNILSAYIHTVLHAQRYFTLSERSDSLMMSEVDRSISSRALIPNIICSPGYATVTYYV